MQHNDFFKKSLSRILPLFLLLFLSSLFGETAMIISCFLIFFVLGFSILSFATKTTKITFFNLLRFFNTDYVIVWKS